MAERRVIIDHLVLHGVPHHRQAAVKLAVEQAMTRAMQDQAIATLPPAALQARLGNLAQGAISQALAAPAKGGSR
jgi:hypothetical protein